MTKTRSRGSALQSVLLSAELNVGVMLYHIPEHDEGPVSSELDYHLHVSQTLKAFSGFVSRAALSGTS